MNHYQASTGDLVYSFKAIDEKDARKWITSNLDISNNMDWVLIKLKELYGYKNTSSSAGNGEYYVINPVDIVRINVWFNLYGNPSYGFIMNNGDTYLLIDDYGAMNGISHLSRQDVRRKKDLV